jgi:hypothetical protein
MNDTEVGYFGLDWRKPTEDEVNTFDLGYNSWSSDRADDILPVVREIANGTLMAYFPNMGETDPFYLCWLNDGTACRSEMELGYVIEIPTHI